MRSAWNWITGWLFMAVYAVLYIWDGDDEGERDRP